ncbi:DNA helicase Ecym_6004 [Eremothecium cymbalariae DBVPG|uniref:DNA 3'-5' helicase n=1 Tax=Eremothecium cymbalariae (strain CBS 270.75 / DBVPG 7215 / KCTC 17166 / NRRL Y-17582) TaxID=931890 RepID=G8JUT3_ERECY|nr:hypothetical protein Ecym_6004 [Eremothecium cymbalariae DBVPG\
MQSEAFHTLFETNSNCLISSPTGSGKTVLFELAILNLLKTSNDPKNLKILYMAPTKSLCSEKYQDWGSTFLNLSVGMLTSDTSYLEADKVRTSNIIITTPEKWDLLTRKWNDYERLFRLIRLIMVDEIHILRDQRGSTLEVVLTRMNTMCNDIRIIAVSATVPNALDISEWLKSGSNNSPAETLIFDDSYRQVMLEKFVYGYPSSTKNDFQLDSMYNSKLIEIINKHSIQKPVLVFCPTRNSTVSTAKYLSQNRNLILASVNRYKTVDLQDKQLRDISSYGIAFHHAGLSLDDRNTIEKSFLNGTIKILCSTSTLAVGVNLPAYLVVIKGTKMWQANISQEYSELDILQMIGRAGRPKFEKKGCAVIMTSSEYKERYEMLVNGTEQLESCLHVNLVEHLAAEVSLKSVTSTQTAVEWLKNTFLYIRFKKNPTAYKEIRSYIAHGSNMDRSLEDFCDKLLKTLLQNQVIYMSNGFYDATPYGKAMTRHYILFETIKRFVNTPPCQSVNMILKLLCESQEFEQIRVKHSEKKLYREINMSPLMRYPYIDTKNNSQVIDTRQQKVSLLVQYELCGLEFPTYRDAIKHHQTLIQERMLVFRHCHRILKCMVDCFIEKGDGISLKNTLFLLRSVNAKGWEDSPMVLRQLNNIGLISVRKFVQRNVNSLQDLANISDIQIESILNLRMGGGLKVKKDLEMLPKLHIEFSAEDFKYQGNVIDVCFKIEVGAEFKTSVWHGQNLSLVVLTLKTSGELLDFRRISLQKMTCSKKFRVSAGIASIKDIVEFTISCENVAGINASVQFLAKDLPPNLAAVLPGADRVQPTKESPLTISDFNNFDLSDDDILSYVEDTKQETVTHIQRRQIANGNYECNHTCKNKASCRHLCCKEGIPASMIKDNKNSKQKISVNKSTGKPRTTHSSVITGPNIQFAEISKDTSYEITVRSEESQNDHTKDKQLDLSFSSSPRVDSVTDADYSIGTPKSVALLASKYNMKKLEVSNSEAKETNFHKVKIEHPSPPQLQEKSSKNCVPSECELQSVPLKGRDEPEESIASKESDTDDLNDEHILDFLGSDIELAV